MKTSGTIENIEMNRFRESKKQNEIRTEDQMALHDHFMRRKRWTNFTAGR